MTMGSFGATRYAQMTDEELLSLIPATLTDSALEALQKEVHRRGLKTESIQGDGQAVIQTELNPSGSLIDKPVGGWLAVLCFSMIFGSVLGLIQLGVSNHAISTSYFEEFPRLYPAIVAHTILTVLLLAMFFYGGISLWRKWRRAVQIAKISLLALLIYALLVPFYPFLMGLPTELRDILVRSFAKALIPSYLWLLGCFLYLMRSRRVRETFQPSA